MARLTFTELDIMNALWKRGPLTAKDVHRFVIGSNQSAYPATRTVLGRMVTKGLVRSTGHQRFNHYTAVITHAQGLAPLIRQFADSVLQISSMDLLKILKKSLPPQTHNDLEQFIRSDS